MYCLELMLLLFNGRQSYSSKVLGKRRQCTVVHYTFHCIILCNAFFLFVGADVFHQPNIQIKLAECEEIGIFCRNFAEKFILKFAKLFYIKNTRIYAILQHNL